MTPRLRYLLWTSRGSLTAPWIVAATAFVVVPGSSTWRGDWWWGYNHLTQALPMAMILIAFSAGWDSGSPATGHRALVDRGPVSMARVIVTLTSPSVLPSMVVAATGFLAVAWMTLSERGVLDSRAALLLLNQLLMLAVAGMFGVAAGRLLPAPYSAAAGAAAVAALLYVQPWPGQPGIFTLPGTQNSVVGAEPNLRWAIVVLVASLLALAFLISAVGLRGTYSRARSLTATLLAAATLLLAGLALPAHQFAESSAKPSRCLTASFELCVYPGYDRILGAAYEQLKKTISRADAVGVPASSWPSRFAQFGGKRLDDGVGVLSMQTSALADGRLDASSIAESMSAPLWCPAMFASSPPLKLLDARRLVYDWVLWVNGRLGTTELGNRDEAFRGKSHDQSAAIVRRSLASLRTCGG